MMETSDVFSMSQIDPREPGAFDFLHHALFDYREERRGTTLHIEGRVGRQQTVSSVGQMLFDAFDSDENATFLDRGEGRLSILLNEPRSDGVTVIEVDLKPAE